MMSDRLMDIPLIDQEQIDLLREALDDDDLAAMMADLPRASHEAIESIAAAARSNDLDQARRAAHVLKGVASSFGAARLASLAREIELEMGSVTDILDALPLLAEIAEQTALSRPGRMS